MEVIKMKVLNGALILSFLLCSSLLAGWQNDLAVADKLLESGYYEAAIEDYQRIVSTYADMSPAVDRAWWGMGKAYHITGNMDAAKLALEKCLERDMDETACSGARELYRQMANEASLQKQEMEKAVQFFEMRYHNTSWLNIITKLFDYFDLRKARKEFTQAQEHADTFDPRYLIDPVNIEGDSGEAEGNKSFELTAEEMDALLNKAARNQEGTSAQDIDAGSSGEDSAEDSSETMAEGEELAETEEAVEQERETESQELSANPHADLKERRDNYLEAYRTLQDALRGKDQRAIQQANEAFQRAQSSYKEAQQAVAAMQNP